MSEYTTIYLRRKDLPLLQNKEYPSYAERENMSEEDYEKALHEVQEYNDQVDKSLGCKLFYLSTTPSRQLDMLPWSPEPKILAKAQLAEILNFYEEEIKQCKEFIDKNKDKIAKLDVRILKANVDLYDKIDKEINECNESMMFEEEELENYQYWYNQFAFCSSIINDKSNSEDYELIYTNC